jgi:hypothetical protein
VKERTDNGIVESIIECDMALDMADIETKGRMV